MLPLLAVIFSWVWQQWQFFLPWLKRTMIDNNTRGAWLAIISTVFITLLLYTKSKMKVLVFLGEHVWRWESLLSVFNYSLLAFSDSEKVLGPCNKIHKRTIAGKRSFLARQKGATVMVEFLKNALAAHVAMVFNHYILWDVSKSDNEDERTLREIFYLMGAEVADITYHESLQIIVEAMLATLANRYSAVCDDVKDKVYTRDIFCRD